jgi:Spy/CpxP family protein refolding chaperone
MMKNSSQPTIQITLTPEQKAQIQQATGKQVTALKLQTLEERCAPALIPN